VEDSGLTPSSASRPAAPHRSPWQGGGWRRATARFCHLRKNGQTEAGYPWRLRRYHDVVYTNQDAGVRDGRLILPHGKSGTLRIRIPDTLTLPGRLMEVRPSHGVVRLICAVPDAARPQQTVIGVDLGVSTLIAATDGAKIILISGRAAKATIQYCNKQLARLQQAQAGKVRGSRHHKRLQRRTYAMLEKTTRQAAHAFPERHLRCRGAVP
jgi:transposase